MKCAKCSAEMPEEGICKTCHDTAKNHVLKSLEEFMDANYPPNQYKTFNARIKAKIKELVESDS